MGGGPLPLRGARVVDFSTGIAGSYCSKLLSDAGADVVKVEDDGDERSLRRWCPVGAVGDGGVGALFAHLNAGKRSTRRRPGDRSPVADLVDQADLVVEDGAWSDDEVESTASAPSSPVVLSLSWWGRGGPRRDRPANEFVLQAACGTMKARGSPDRPPLAAGGRLGEWIAGAYAATAALAALDRPPPGGHLDVSVFECMCLTMGGQLTLAGHMGQPRLPRYVEQPSVEETADGYVGFCTVTRQQFSDFMAMIGHPDLADDDDLASYVGRQRQRELFDGLVRQWCATRSTQEILELASLMRIPVAPIGRASTVPTFDHFAERRVFELQPGGGFLRPRPPYRLDGDRPGRMGSVPEPGGLGDEVGWPGPRSAGRPVAPPGDRLPLADLRVVDLTAFWAGPCASHLLAALGAEVVKVESIQRPDGMRFSSAKTPKEVEAWWEWSPIFQWMNVNKAGITLDLASARGRELFLQLVERADVVIENFTPRVVDQLGLGWDAVREANERVVMVRMPAFGLSGPWRDRPGFAQTMEQVSGMAWITGYREGVPIVPKGPCDPTAGIHAAFATLVGVRERDRRGGGVLVEVPMVETALNISAQSVVEYSAYGIEATRMGNRSATAAPQGAYACLGQDEWVALAVEDDRQWRALVAVVGDQGLEEPGLAAAAGRRSAADLIDGVLAAWASGREAAAAEQELLAAGVPSARVVSPYELDEDEQLRWRGFFETADHPLAGPLEVMTLPFRWADGVPWVRRVAPTLGRDNHLVLGELGLAGAALDELEASGIIGQWPVGA